MSGPPLLVLLLTGTLVAFGGIYAWALPGILIGALLLIAVAPRLRDGGDSDTRALNWALAALAAAIACQLIPLPEWLRALLSPHAAALDTRIRPDAVLRTDLGGPLSADPSATIAALTLVVTTALTYRAARAIFSAGGVRYVCRAISVAGALVAIEAIVQRAIAPGLIYGFWKPFDTGAQPFGPVVNRNHLAGWLVMASALAGGYFMARAATRMRGSSERLASAVTRIARSPASLTAAAWLIMAATIAGAQSRSGVIAFAASLMVTARSRTRRWTTAAAVTAGIALLAVTLAMAAVGGGAGTMTRFAETLESSDVSRVVIWREAAVVAGEFWLTGVGAGAFGTAMAGLQQTHSFADHLGANRLFNHAHNHYLQLAAEGGVLVAAPFAVVLVLFARLAARRVKTDHSEMRAVRIGALAGLVGVAVQSVWEVPLTMPAAALLAATLAAIATYQRTAQSPALAPDDGYSPAARGTL